MKRTNLNYEEWDSKETMDLGNSHFLNLNMENINIKNYIVSGGELFTIKMIDTIKDGGTKVIITTKNKFYVHKKTKKFHSNYPPNNENLITDVLLYEYLIHEIKIYILNCKKKLIYDEKLLDDIELNNKNKF